MMTTNKKKKVVILGSSGYVLNSFTTSVPAALSVAGANTGNFIFQYATRKIIGDNASTVNVGLGEDNSDGTMDALKASDVVVMPAANHLRADADWTGFNGFLDRIDKPIVVLGLGAQAEKAGDIKKTLERLRENKTVVRMCDILSAKSAYIGVRGVFSQEIAAGLGMSNAVVTGCPSILLSEATDLGLRLQDILERVRVDPDLTKVCMVAETPYNIHGSPEKTVVEQQLFRYIYKNKGRYIQQSGGEHTILASIGDMPFDMKEQIEWLLSRIAPDLTATEALDYMRANGRVFFSAPDWIEYLRKFDICLGHRFHGNMAALAANRLGVVITHDSRTAEMVECMKIPYMSADFIASGNLTNLSIAKNIQFDAIQFDMRRAFIAGRILDAFGRLGINLEVYIHAIARMQKVPTLENGASPSDRQAAFD